MATSRISDRSRTYDWSHLLAVGAVAGFVAGLGFILANMIYATSQGSPAIAPFAAIGTIFFFDDAPQMNLNYVLTGVIVHFGNSVLFGMIFALLVPLFRNAMMLVAGAILYGLALYVVNFLILGSLVFKVFSPFVEGGPNQLFELIVHPAVFGVLLIPFFLQTVRRTSQVAADRRDAHSAEPRTSSFSRDVAATKPASRTRSQP